MHTDTSDCKNFGMIVRENDTLSLTVEQFSFKELWSDLKCGFCEHHLKCQNNHQHDCGDPRKENYYYYSITISITNISTNGFDARHHDYKYNAHLS